MINYKAANDYNFNKMKHEMNKEYRYDWASDKLDNYCLGRIPRLQLSYYHIEEKEKKQKLSDLIKDLNFIIEQYNKDKNKFDDLLVKIDDLASYISEISNSYYLREYDLQETLNIATKNRSLFISGPGGIGKSFYLNEISRQINDDDIICLFGKYEKNIVNIDWDEILDICNTREFTVVIDAINEFSEEHRAFIKKIKDEIIGTLYGRIILSYRSNSLTEEELNELKNKLNEFIFPGISYEDAVIKLVQSTSANISDLEFVLDTNNPLIIEMLRKILVGRGVQNGELSSILLITHIYENYIKISLSDAHWKITKEISKFYYENELVYISEKDLANIVPNEIDRNGYLRDMTQLGFIDSFKMLNQMNFTFRYQSLSDYIIARSMFDDIEDKTNEEVIKLLNRKMKSFYSMSEIFMILLFDKYHKRRLSDFIDIFETSELSKSLDVIEFLTKIMVKNEQVIQKLQKSLKLDFSLDLFYNVAGREDKPYNCVNFFNEELFSDNDKIIKLYKGTHYSNVQNRLFNSIYFINRFDSKNSYVEEKFWFAFWCLGSRRPRERVLAEKLLLDIVNITDGYVELLIKNYYSVFDDYIRNSIIKVLYSVNKNHENEIDKFFETLIYDVNMIDRDSLHYITSYFRKENEYINYMKRDLYKESNNDKVIESVLKYLHRIEFNKNYLTGMDYHQDPITYPFNEKFLEVDKREIFEVNKLSNSKYKCLMDGDCKFSNNVLPDIISEEFPSLEIEKVDGKKYYLAWQRMFVETLHHYDFSVDDLYDIPSYSDSTPYHNNFKSSYIWKLVTIATEKFYGSLMCNYYHGDFITYDIGDGEVGFKPYSRHKEHYEYNLNAPVSIYNEMITKIEAQSIARIKQTIPEVKTVDWANDFELSQHNLMELVKPISYKAEKWIMVSGSIRIRFEDHKNVSMPLMYSDEYVNVSMCIGEMPILTVDNRRSLTIEKNDYLGNIEEFKNAGFNVATEMPRLSSYSTLIQETSFTLPPSDIIKYFNLKYVNSDSSWYSGNEKVIVVNNNPSDWYRDEITKGVYIREDFFNRLKKDFTISYLAFTERFHVDTGYNNDSAIFARFNSEEIFDFSFNYKDESREYIQTNDNCVGCVNKRPEFDSSKLPRIIFLNEDGIEVDIDKIDGEDIGGISITYKYEDDK